MRLIIIYISNNVTISTIFFIFIIIIEKKFEDKIRI